MLLRAFIGGALQQHLLDYSDNDLLNLVLADLQDLLGIIGQYYLRYADGMDPVQIT